MEHQVYLETLKRIELKENKADKILQKLKGLEKFGVIITTLHSGKKIIRARLSNKKSFEFVSQLSYKPEEYNLTYQRASTPNKTMFYGSIIPEIVGQSEPQTARITVAFELSEFLRDVNTIGEQDIVFSAWEVKEDIELVSLVHHKGFERPTKLSTELQSNFEKFAAAHPKLKASTLEISEFLGNQFAKLPIKKNTDYMISAIYSQLITSTYDGVLYPSVRMAGEGINIAIKQDTVTEKLKFLGASECTIYKNGKAVFIGNNTKSVEHNGKIKFVPLEKEYLVSKDFGRKQVGIQ